MAQVRCRRLKISTSHVQAPRDKINRHLEPGIWQENRSNPGFQHFVGSGVNDLLLYVPMIASLFTIGILWHVIQTYPGFLEALGYLYGILVASFCLDALKAYMESDLE